MTEWAILVALFLIGTPLLLTLYRILRELEHLNTIVGESGLRVADTGHSD